jgi:hypothetical protein
MSARGTRRYLIGFVSILGLLIGGWLLLLREVAQPKSNDPAWIFNYGSIGNETAQGLPYWIWQVLPVVFSGLISPGVPIKTNLGAFFPFSLF